MRTLLIFTLILIAGMYLHADGVEPDGTGTENDPYQVATLENLLWMSTNSMCWSSHFVQTNDIDAAETANWNDGTGFCPMGTRTNPFMGEYDGCDYQIENLYMNYPGAGVGMFYIIYCGSIANVHLNNVDISGGNSVGSLARFVNGNTMVVNCHASGVITCSVQAGGLIYNANSSTLIDCTSDVDMVMESGNGGGLLSICAETLISNCSSSGNVSGGSCNAGLISYARWGTEIENCFSTGNIQGDDSIGGLVSTMYGTDLRNSYYNYDEVELNGEHIQTIGGLPNELYTTWMENGMSLDVDDYLTLSNNRYLIQSVDDLKLLSAFGQTAEYPFSLTCDLDLASYPEVYVPYLGNDFYGNERTISNLSLTDGSRSCVGLFGAVNEASIYDLYVTNATVSGGQMTSGLAGSISNSSAILGCMVDGTIQGGEFSGLLTGYTYQAWIEDSNVFGLLEAPTRAGGIAGCCDLNSTIYKCTACCTIIAESDAGGIVGFCWDNVCLRNCTSSGTVMGMYYGGALGGIAGVCQNSVIEDCGSTSYVSGNSNIGGLIGMSIIHTSVTGCYSTGEVLAIGSDVGGLIGTVSDTTVVSNCYSSSRTISNEERVGGLIGTIMLSLVTDSYSSGQVVGSAQTGGLIGEQFESEIAGSFWDIETSEQDESSGGTGLATDQMLDVMTYLDAGWDFTGETGNGEDDIWSIDSSINAGYPYLSWQIFLAADEELIVPPTNAITSLHGNYPNPFNPETTISFSVKQSDEATLTIYNLRGQKVKSFPLFHAGEHKVIWDGRNDFGKTVASGVYLSRLESKSSTLTRKMMLVK